MKKVLFLLIALLASGAVRAQNPLVFGDYDHDGKITEIDVAHLINVALGQEDPLVLSGTHRFMMEDFVIGGDDRYGAPTSFERSWAAGEIIGVLPLVGSKLPCIVPDDHDGSKIVTFYGNAWSLDANTNFLAYYPYSANVDHPGVMHLKYGEQVQTGNNNPDHIFDYDYMLAKGTELGVNDYADLEMKHLGCLLKFTLTLPEADEFSSFTLTHALSWSFSSNQFLPDGTIDLSAIDPASRYFSSDIDNALMGKKSNSLTMELKDVSIQSTDEKVIIYMMVNPSMLGDEKITVSLKGKNGAIYKQTCWCMMLSEGKIYCYSLELEKTQAFEYKAVDLGLPSGLKWADCNIGATVPEEYGDFYAWGEVETKTDYFESNYAHYQWIDESRYTDADGFDIIIPAHAEYTDLGNICGTDYDVATKKMGGNWRMPTTEDFEELKTQCTWEWGSKNAIYGYKITGPNGNWIFLPVAGLSHDMGPTDVNNSGYYWSGSPSPTWKPVGDDPDSAYFLFFRSGYIENSYRGKSDGCSVRGVTP